MYICVVQVLEHLESSGNEQHQVQHQEPMDLDHLGIGYFIMEIIRFLILTNF